jgi:L-threonylcarbamoyladenylate synthase
MGQGEGETSPLRTHVLRVDPATPEPETIGQAAAVLRAGGLVAFPTETVYGLGANALDATAARGIYVAKQRDASDPCIVHLADADDLLRVARVESRAVARLAAVCWPGPLSLVLPKTDAVPDVVTAGQPTVAVRVPAHPVARALIRAAGVPVAAPSANLFMHTSPTTADHVLADLNGRIDLLLDGGPTSVGVESTILDLTRTPPLLLRPGGVPLELLRDLLGQVAVRTGEDAGATVAPGLMAKHYAPRARVELVDGPRRAALAQIAARVRLLAEAGEKVGLLLPGGELDELDCSGLERYALGEEDDVETQARLLYAGLRALDSRGVDVILARDPGEEGLGRAIRDRLVRAAGKGH